MVSGQGGGTIITGGGNTTGTPNEMLTDTLARAGAAIPATSAIAARAISVFVFIRPFDGRRG
jgi:hypothetical protein